jgi:hypothetical protein
VQCEIGFIRSRMLALALFSGRQEQQQQHHEERHKLCRKFL